MKKVRSKRQRIKGLLQYFEDKNLGTTFNRKYDNARYKVYKVFDECYFDENANKDKIIPLLKGVLPELKFLLKKLKAESEYPDNRRGWETEFEAYGYSDPAYELSYISDRWMCEFRVQWIIDLFDPKGGGF